MISSSRGNIVSQPTHHIYHTAPLNFPAKASKNCESIELADSAKYELAPYVGRQIQNTFIRLKLDLAKTL